MWRCAPPCSPAQGILSRFFQRAPASFHQHLHVRRIVQLGLLYRQGYFHQRVDLSGWQQEYWILTDPERLPAALVERDDGTPLTVTVPIAEADVTAQVWRVDVGRVSLYLLDTAVPGNDESAAEVTDRLYGGDVEHRLRQEIVLGIGGTEVLNALGIEHSVLHLNEGHPAFAILERIRERVEGGMSFEEISRDLAACAATPIKASTGVSRPSSSSTYTTTAAGVTVGGVCTDGGNNLSRLQARNQSTSQEAWKDRCVNRR